MQIIFPEQDKDSGKSFMLTSSTDPKCPWWLSRDDGEGMAITEKDLYDIFDEHFNNNF